MAEDADVTRMIGELAAGDRSAAGRLLPHVYDKLRALAASYLQRQQPGHTLQPTALVHEAFVKLADTADPNWQSRKHFFDVAAMAMRQLRTFPRQFRRSYIGVRPGHVNEDSDTPPAPSQASRSDGALY